MRLASGPFATTLLAWLLAVALGGVAIVRWDIARRRDAFEAQAQIAHRLLSQRAVQNDAVLEMLGLLGAGPAALATADRFLRGTYPQIVGLGRRDRDGPWPQVGLAQAESLARDGDRAAAAGDEAGDGRYWLVRAGDAGGVALRIEPRAMVPWDEWPFPRDGPARVTLGAPQGGALTLQPGLPEPARPFGLTLGFVFRKALASASQPFELTVQQATGPAQWPWPVLAGWAAASGIAAGAVALGRHWRRERRRAESLLRVGRIARLNALGELAGGVAHELNQPLAAVLANAQAARRLLADDEPDLDTARRAIDAAAGQARRASDVVGRLRRLVESPDAGQPRLAVALDRAVAAVLDLLEPEIRRQGVRVSVEGGGVAVLAEPVALEQIVHNLVGNALQALADVPRAERRLRLRIDRRDGVGMLAVRDDGPGIAPADRQRIFEPFFTTRAGGLGLGLSLCETLAQSMGGILDVRDAPPRGTEFRLELPLAGAPDRASANDAAR